jgi:type II secretory pathway component PulF
MKAKLEDGCSLHAAMSHHPKIFSKLDIGLVRMGEQSGVLPQSLSDLARFLEWKEDIRSVIKRAVIYPCFLLLAIAAVAGVWLGYVLPQVGKLLLELGVELPTVTRILLASSAFLTAHWPWLAPGVVLFLCPLVLLQRTKKGNRLVHKNVLRLPLVGEVLSNLACSRLCHNFSIMHRSGMTIPRIFETLSDHLLGNRYLEGKVAQAFQELQLGQSLSESFEHAGGFPPLLLEGIRHGELTGKLEDSFKRMGDFYDGEARRTVQMLISSFEPLLIIVMGGIFGLIVLSILLPLYDVLSGYAKAY